MQHVRVDLPMAISMVLKQIEKAGPDFKHKDDPNQPLGNGGCHNVFVDTDYSDVGEGGSAYHPGCLIGRVIVDSYEGDKDDIYEMIVGNDGAQADFYGLTTLLRNTGTLDFETTYAASDYLKMVQTKQDNNKPWGVAHAQALSYRLRYGYFENLTPREAEFFEPRGKILDLPEAVRLVLEVIEEKGEDFTHQDDPIRKEANNSLGSQCVNVFVKWDPLTDADEYLAPGCLIGSAIHKAGWALETFGEYNVKGGPAADLLRQVVSEGLYGEVTPRAKEYMTYVQRGQDNGKPWGIAHMNGLSQALKAAFFQYGCETTFTQAEWKWLDIRPGWTLCFKGVTDGSSI